jgi:hypothetical protein
VLSQAAILSSWSDARFGTIANVILALGVIYGVASEGPWSFRSAYRAEVALRGAIVTEEPVVTERDLASLPPPVRQYLRVAGAVGQPRVRSFQARWRGRIRGAPDAPWMAFTAEQYNVIDEPARFFLMDAVRTAVPVDVYHAFHGRAATMRVRLASLVPIVSAAGPEMTRAETVTLFNDICILAPSALVDPRIQWEPIDQRSVRARYTAAGNTIDAVLSFNDAGELVNFVSDDRLVASPDGRRFTRERWSTPSSNYRQFGPWRVASRGEGRWHPASGEYAYIEVELLDLRTGAAAREP